jgi:hypothetical protein
MRESGFTDQAMVKLGKSTGQQIVMVVHEEVDTMVENNLTNSNFQKAMAQKVEYSTNSPVKHEPDTPKRRPMWPETE